MDLDFAAIWASACEAAAEYVGTGWYFVLFLAALVYLYLNRKETRMRDFFGNFSLLCLVLIFFPVTSKIIEKCIEGSFWRIFWILPSYFLIAYAAVRLVLGLMDRARGGKPEEAERRPGRKKSVGKTGAAENGGSPDGNLRPAKKTSLARKIFSSLAGLLLAAAFCVLFAAMGRSLILTQENFTERENNVKINAEAVNMCGAIERDAANMGITEKRLVCTSDIMSYIREYDASITMPYGRNAIQFPQYLDDPAYAVYTHFESGNFDWADIDVLLRQMGCNYLIYYVDEYSRAILENMGYEMICIGDGHYLYRVPEERYEKELEGPEVLTEGELLITQYPAANGSQSEIYTIEDADGHLILVDGGWTADAKRIRSIIEEHGNHVDLWILSHAHSDHVGAFLEIMADPGDITVDEILTVPLTYEETQKNPLDWEEYGPIEALTELLKTMDNVTYAADRDVYERFGITIEILNAWSEETENYTSDLMNDGSLMFRISAGDETMLFCSDVGANMSDHLLEEYGASLASTYIAMGHHGNGGLNADFYQAVHPKAAFFDAPRWLIENTIPSTGHPGSYTTPEKLEIMRNMGCEIYTYITAPNQIILR